VQTIEEDIQANTDKYVSDIKALNDYKNKDKAKVLHVLIMSEGSKFENPKEIANEVLAKAKAGEDFVALMEEYNEDPGATAAGYTFGPGEMVQEFEKASFALDLGEISDIVQTDYGYHIIKRMVGTAELQNYWKTEADVDIKKGVLKKISVSDILNAVIDTQKKLQEMNMSEEAVAEQENTEGEENHG
jgi:foldase protein PrsA